MIRDLTSSGKKDENFSPCAALVARLAVAGYWLRCSDARRVVVGLALACPPRGGDLTL
jgi:hypothetical protein